LESFDLARVLKFLPGIIIGLTVHEFCHAWVAHLCGDSTSKNQGRVTLNPLKHIDLIGFIMIVALGFGWAKPVEFNEQNLRNPKRDVILIAIAGPLSNAITAIILSILLTIISHVIPVYESSGMIMLSEIIRWAIYINWMLFIFNLIPLPPLDGSHVAFSWLKKFPAVYAGLFKYGSFLLFGIIIVSVVAKINLLPIFSMVQFIAEGFLTLVGYR
jgi:Zn-dependent protease